MLLWTTIATPISTNPDISSLLSFRNNLKDPSNSLLHWSISDPSSPCSWTGVSCDEQNRVISLSLPSLSLQGNLSLDHLCDLKYLQHLDLHDNLLHGSLPPKMGSSLPSLQSLDLSFNLISGPIPPPSFNGKLQKSLSSIALSGNSLSGPLPAELWEISSLIAMDFSSSPEAFLRR